MSRIILFLGTPEDRAYMHIFKSCVRGDGAVKTNLDGCSYLPQAELLAKKANTNLVVSSCEKLLASVLSLKKAPKLSDYAGSMISRNGIQYLFITPLIQLVTTKTGKFLTTRYLSKYTNPQSWFRMPAFKWTLLSHSNVTEYFESFKTALLIGIDIETKQEFARIDCISFTALFPDMTTQTVVLELTDMWAVTWMRKFCWELQAAKVFQNGKYDIAYLTRFGAPVYNYMLDTAAMMHCTYSELPKSLDALAVFWIWDGMYWKDLAKTGDRYEYFKYNALDSWNTVLIAIAWLLTAPEYAKRNYLMEFPLVFPTHLCDMTGIQRDMTRLDTEYKKRVASEEGMHNRLQAMTWKNFNPGSPVQVKNLLKAIGCEDLTSTDEKNLKKAALRHPLNGRILNLILDIRGERKLISTYLSPGKEFRGTILYSLIPWGTDSGRLASQEHHFWCGLQIQNIPAGDSVKKTLKAYEGFKIAECDLEQAESRDTAYISGDTALIHAVESDHDFHSLNCSAFFGIPYEQIYTDVEYYDQEGNHFPAGVINKPLRNLSKRVNHGANYNMGPNTLVETMGEDKVYEAARLLKLPRFWPLKKIAEHLLASFHKTYPTIRNRYYKYVIETVMATRLLVGATGWTRYCFGNPKENKLDLNSYVAHCPQSLNAMKLNKAFMRVFYEIALPNPEDFRLNAQIHDSILFQFREGRVDLAHKVQELMHVTIPITSCTGEKYTYTVPAALKAGKDGLGADYWSDTE